ncbi:thiosulfate reductase PhsA [Halarcobacter ebronensis]|uniref:Thiosulfate reductase PhsA n=1 Tax=Halarcobacter ebronensis TaxID=1462615 RepID=A0A4Q1AJW7_9BACT|nr:thiosulfate reductase PhsA [Halarcobacter ebronensis]QKF81678.1 putative thiosulfate/polysulfide reductase, molybdenum-binding subunit [Halarcobacter ebronensis]RXK04641.1 thiosulfate reductase PhsA [Halarcobacter ebronensis]
MSSTYSRRDFLKTTSCTAIIAGSSCMAAKLGSLDNNIINGGVTKSVNTYCEMCSSRCQIECKVVDGKVSFIEGNKHSKGMSTSVCARGASGHSQLYDNQRLVKPMIRVGKRGEDKWMVVSYEKAYDFIAEKLKKITDEYGAKATLFSSKTGENFNHIATFANIFGSPNIFSHVSTCPITYDIAFEHTYGGKLKRDFSNAKYILNFGHNLFEGIAVSKTKKLAHAANSEKTKLVVLDPRFSVVASKADEWYPVKPGTDLAFVLSLIHVWLRDGKYDKEFVEKYTIGIEKLIESTKDTTPKWQEQITGIKAEVAERVANEIYKAAPNCIIDWGHKTTTGASEYQKTRAILVANVLMGNLEKAGGLFFGKKAKSVNKIANMDIAPVITNPDGHIKYIQEERIDHATQKGANVFVSRKMGVLMDIPDAILSQKPYPVKAWIMTRTNPLITVANSQKMKKAMEKLDLIVVNDVYMSETAMMADVVLPEATYLERDEGIADVSSMAPAYMMRNKVVDPINKTQTISEILRALAKRLDLDSNYKWQTVTNFRVQQAKGNSELLEKLAKDGYVSFGVPSLLYREKSYVDNFVKKYPSAASNLDSDGLFANMLKFKTPSGKIEIFSEEVEENFPGYGVPAKHDTDVAKGYPYIITSGKTALHTNGHTQNIPFLNMLMSDNPVWVNPLTAKKENIKNGDLIYLENNIGKEKATVFVTEAIRPDTLFVYMGFGRESEELKRANGKGTSQSKLLSLDKGPVCSTMITNIGVKITKA